MLSHLFYVGAELAAALERKSNNLVSAMTDESNDTYNPTDRLILPAILVRPGQPTPAVAGMGADPIRLPVTIRYSTKRTGRRIRTDL